MDTQFDHKELQKVAALYCEGMSKESIASTLSRQENNIQEMLERAEQEKYFKYQLVLKKEPDPEVREFVYNEIFTTALKDVLKDTMAFGISELNITPSPISMFTKFEIDAREDSEEYNEYRKVELESLQMASRRAGQILSTILLDGKNHIVGIPWGVAIKETIEHIHPLPTQLKDVSISVVSIFGDLEYFVDPKVLPWKSMQLQSNYLVAQLSQKLGGEKVFLNVPAFIPARFSKDPKNFAVIREFLTNHSSYQMIFGGPLQGVREVGGITNRPPEAKISQMDTIITGFGSADNYTLLDRYLQSYLDEKEISLLRQYCRDGKIVGDIGGHRIPSLEWKNDPELENFLNKINSRVITAQPSDFKDVATRYRKEKLGAGVIGVTVGARKASLLHTLLSENPCSISRLVIDTHCALALLHSIAPQELEKFVKTETGRQLVINYKNWSTGTKTMIPITV